MRRLLVLVAITLLAAPAWASPVDALRAIAAHNLGLAAAAPEGPGELPAFGACQRLGAAERAAIQARVASWIATSEPKLQPTEDAALTLVMGCSEATGVI